MADMARKTNFAVTCSLLSRYIKEKRSVADLGLGMAPPPQDAAKGKPEAFRPPPTTVNLLPGADVSGGEDSEREREVYPQRAGRTPAVPGDTREQEKAQLTIFYGGEVLVFDNFPAEKAKDLMQLASSGNSTAQNLGYTSPCPTTSMAISRGLSGQNSTTVPQAANTSMVSRGHLPRSAQPYLSDLPIARRASLQRFLEKRKHRINARAPYQVTASTEMGTCVKQEDSNSWLVLGSQFSIPSLGLSSEYSR